MTPIEYANDAARNTGTDAANQGPPADLPEVVPDFVSDLLETISAGVAGLGERVSDIAASANPAEAAIVVADVAAALPV